jgi:enoyl-CoA hydratase
MSAQPEDFHVEHRGPVAVFCIDRPHRANALSRAVLLALGRFAREMAPRDDVRALVVTGAGDRHFCAGADLAERRGWDDDEVRHQLSLYRSELGALDVCPKVVVAAINGVALGGGLEISMACDLRVAAPHASFGQPETALAIIPGAGGTQRLPRLVGPARAKEMILLGRRLTASEALSWGLVNRVSGDADVLDDVIEWLRPVIEGAPIAQACALEAIDAAVLPLDEGLEVEARAYERVLCSEDRMEGLRAFAEKRPARYQGR